MRSKYHFVSRRQIAQCKYCGADIVWQQYARGGWYPSDVIARDGQLLVVAGSGNHYNLKQRHDCLLEARTRIRSLNESIAILITQIWDDQKIAEYSKGLAQADWSQYPTQKEMAQRWLDEALQNNPKLIALRTQLKSQIAYYQARLNKEGKA